MHPQLNKCMHEVDHRSQDRCKMHMSCHSHALYVIVIRLVDWLKHCNLSLPLLPLGYAQMCSDLPTQFAV